MKGRQQALKHSWDSAAEQLNGIYYDAVNKARAHGTKPSNLGMDIVRLVYYGFGWLLCMFLALSLMAPFVQVSSPHAAAQQTRSKDRRKHDSPMTDAPCFSS